jgi:hypothetical protein
MRPDRKTVACCLQHNGTGSPARLPAVLLLAPPRHAQAAFGAARRGMIPAFLWALLCLSLHAARAVDMDVLVGYGQSTTSGARYRPETWTPLTVYLTGQGARGVGQLQVSVRVAEHTTLYTRRVPLKDGAINEAVNFTVQLRNPDINIYNPGGSQIDIQVQLIMDGRTLAGPKKLALPGAISLETYNVLGLTRDGAGLNVLGKKKLGLFHKHYNPAHLANMGMQNGNSAEDTSHHGINPNATLQVLYTDPRALPVQTQGYDAIDAIALGDLPLDNLSEDQIDAIRDYVRQGGLLVISGGGDLARLKSRFYQEMLPVTPAGTLVVNALPTLAARYDTLLPLTGGAALTRGTLKPGAIALLSGSETGGALIASRPYGCGVVVFTSFDFLDPNIRAWGAGPALWRDLLRCGNREVSARDVLAAAAETNQSNVHLGDALAGKRATNAPPLLMVGLFCGAYLILLVPVNYLVLKKLDKREMTWLTAPVLIAGFTVASYLIARSIKGGDLTVNSAVVVETQANTDQAAGYAQMTVYSPRRATYDIAFGNPDDPNNPYHALLPSEIFTNPAESLGIDLTVDSDANGTTLRNTLIKLWDKRSFETPVAVDLGGTVDAVTRALSKPGWVEVTLTNRTRFALTDCALVGNDTISLGNLVPGAAVTQRMQWNTRTSAINLPVPVPPAPTEADKTESADRPDERREDTPVVTRARIASALLQSLVTGTEQNQYGYQVPHGYGHGANALVARFSDPLLDLRVDGHKPDGQEVNVLVAHLPMPTDAPIVSRAKSDPFAAKPVVDLEDETQPGTRRMGVLR